MATTDSAPGSTASLRTANQRRVLDVLRQHTAEPASATESRLTQADLARMTGLAPATVSNIVRELAAAGLVATEPGSGRRGTSVQLAASAGIVAGVDFGHSHVSVAVGDLTGQLLAEDWRPLDQSHHHEAGLSAGRRDARGRARSDSASTTPTCATSGSACRPRSSTTSSAQQPSFPAG